MTTLFQTCVDIAEKVIMQHFVNFGATRTANRAKKKIAQVNQAEKTFGEPMSLSDARMELYGRDDPNPRNPIKANRLTYYQPNTPEKAALVKQYNQKKLDDYLENRALPEIGGGGTGNKLLKKRWELSGGEVAGDKYLKDYPYPSKSTLQRGRENRREMKGYESKPPLVSNKVRTESNNYSEIRPTSDGAASASGYLGYQKDPYKGYGGMMEEPVPLEEARKVIKRNY
jgi:hypothetical protein